MAPQSFFKLGFYFVLKIFARLLRAGGDRQRVLDNYGSEGLLPLSAQDRTAMQSFSRCIACGLCDEVAGRGAKLRTLPSHFVLGLTRSLPDYAALTAPIEDMRRLPLADLERVCPARIPFVAMVDFASRHHDAVAQTNAKRLPVVS